MTGLRVEVAPHPGQIKIIKGRRRFNVVALGRRSGKSTLGVNLLCRTVIETAGPVAWVSPTYKSLGEIWRETIDRLRPIITSSNATDRRIEIVGGGIIEMWSAESLEEMRGRKYHLVIFDEAAKIKNLLDQWIAVVRPTLGDFVGSAWFLSTPRGLNDFWKLWMWGGDPERKDWASFQMPTECNPHMPPEEIEAMRAEMSERFVLQEIDARFLEMEGAVFSGVYNTTGGIWQPGPLEDHNYVLGVDLARTTDFTVAMVIDTTAYHVCHYIRLNNADWTPQLRKIADTIELFNPMQTVIDMTGIGDMPTLELRKLVPEHTIRAVRFNNANKGQMVEDLSIAIERKDVALLDDPVLLGELIAFESKVSRSGAITYNAPSGVHDDMVTALMLGWSAAKRELAMEDSGFMAFNLNQSTWRSEE